MLFKQRWRSAANRCSICPHSADTKDRNLTSAFTFLRGHSNETWKELQMADTNMVEEIHGKIAVITAPPAA